MANVKGLVTQADGVLARWSSELGMLSEDPRVADPDLSPEGRNRRMTAARDAIREEKAPVLESVLLQLWGDPDTPGMDGGAVWRELDAAAEAVRKAKDAGRAQIDWSGVTAEGARVGVVIEGWRNCDEGADWVSEASIAELLSVASYGHAAIRGRFGGQPGLGSLLAAIEKRRKGVLGGAEVDKAEQKRERAHIGAVAALETLNKSLALLGHVGLGASLKQCGRIRARISAEQSVDAGGVSWRFSKKPRSGGVIMREAVAAK